MNINININNLKEELINLYKNTYIYVENSTWFHYIKEKYEHLQPMHKKITHGTAGLLLLIGLLYYPFSHLYASLGNMKDFTDKKHLIQELLSLSAMRRASSGLQQSIPHNLKNFISQRSETIGLPKEQITTITQTTGQNLKELKTPVRTESVRVELNNLNLKELINYGHQLEILNDNLKVVNINIIENKQKENYFNAIYTLSLFSLTANNSLQKTNPLKSNFKKPLQKEEKINKINKMEGKEKLKPAKKLEIEK